LRFWEEMETIPLLPPYRALAMGAGVDESGPYLAPVLVFASVQMAEEAAPLLRTRVQEAMDRLADTGAPGAGSITSAEVWADEEAVLAKLRGRIVRDGLYLAGSDWFTLLAHE
jgi:hypothetical protein